MLTTVRRLTATAATASLLALPVATLTAGSAAAAQNQKSCAGGLVKLDVERDDGRYEVQAEVDDARQGDRYRVRLFQNGNRFADAVRTIDEDNDLDVDRDRRNTAGRDTFRLRVKNLRSGGACTVRVGVR